MTQQTHLKPRANQQEAHRGDYWPFAKGSEENLALFSGGWLAALLAHLLLRRPLSRLLLWLATPLTLLVLYFFRDPERPVSYREGLVLSPADGEVIEISQVKESRYLNREMTRVSIFLSLFDVHVQRSPVSGRVILIDHQPGQFVQAFRPEASDVNEYIAMAIENPRFGTVLIKQIAGILARRCVNHQQVGDPVRGGSRFGLIRFSSRVDLFLPSSADLSVEIGQKVLGGMTTIATLKPLEPAN